MCLDSKNKCFHKVHFCNTRLPGTAFLMILYVILEAFGGPGLLTFCFLVAPVTNACMFFGSQLTSLIFSVKSDVEEAKNSSQCWLMVEVGGRSGASGGRGRLRLRALKGIVSHI